MTNILVLHTSLNGRDSLSSSLALEYVERKRMADATVRLIERDFASNPVPHLTAERFSAFAQPAGALSDEQRAALADSDALIDELSKADEIVVALPMYNFAIPSTLKAYFDHVARAGVTFRYTPDGPQGLLPADRVTVFATRGGRYVGTPLDTQTDYVRSLFAFLGVAECRFVYAEGTAAGEESLKETIASARRQTGELRAAA